MVMLPKIDGIKVEDYVFPPTVILPGSNKPFFLGGAGVRGIEIEGKFVKYTAIGVYLEANALASLGDKWKGKSATALADSVEFFRDVVTGPFQKFVQVTLISPLTGQEYSEKLIDNCVTFVESIGMYTDEEAKAVEKLIEVFKDEEFSPGQSILFTQSPHGSLTIAFSKHGTIPEPGKVVIENKNLSEAVLETMIGKHGVSPETKQRLAARLSQLLNGKKEADMP